MRTVPSRSALRKQRKGGALRNCTRKKGGWMTFSGVSQCRTRRRRKRNEYFGEYQNDHETGIGRVFFFAARVCVSGYFSPAVRIFHVLRWHGNGDLLQTWGRFTRDILHLASIVLFVSGASSGDEVMGGRTACRNAGTFDDHADHTVAGNRREISRLMAFPWVGAGVNDS